LLRFDVPCHLFLVVWIFMSAHNILKVPKNSWLSLGSILQWQISGIISFFPSMRWRSWGFWNDMSRKEALLPQWAYFYQHPWDRHGQHQKLSKPYTSSLVFLVIRSPQEHLEIMESISCEKNFIRGCDNHTVQIVTNDIKSPHFVFSMSCDVSGEHCIQPLQRLSGDLLYQFKSCFRISYQTTHLRTCALFSFDKKGNNTIAWQTIKGCIAIYNKAMSTLYLTKGLAS
jgi:hypothetical protein